MNSSYGIMIMIISAALAALSQVILKLASNVSDEKSVVCRILNKKVFLAYCILVSTMLMNIFAYKYVEYKVGAIITTLSYVFVLLFSSIILKERLSHKQVIGCVIIILGQMVFNL